MSKRNHLDQYFTPPECTHSLLDFLERSVGPTSAGNFDGRAWSELLAGGCTVAEPCAGENWIADVIRERCPRSEVITMDLDPNMPVDWPGVDARSDTAAELVEGCDLVISNPPFNGGPSVVREMLKRSDRVAMYLRLSFLERTNKQPKSARADLLDTLAHVRILPRHGFIRGKKGSDSMPCAWFIWDTCDLAHQRRRTFDVSYTTQEEFENTRRKLARRALAGTVSQ
jgi:hypothetical protein